MIQNSKQIWAVGEKVKVGFMSLQVVAAKETAGDFKPDAYLLTNGKKYYSFVPHNGLTALYDLHGRIVEEISDAQKEFARI